MKETYFTAETIAELSAQWLKIYANAKKAAAQPFEIQRAGLLILDMQNYFLDENSHAFVPSGPAIISGLNELAALFRSKDRPVLATQHVNNAQNAGMMASWWSDMITDSHPLVDLHPGLNIEKSELITKSQYDAFYQSNLASLLASFQVEQLVIGGVMTHLCCETTARMAFVQGYEVFFLIDGAATYNREYHTSTLRNLAHGAAVLTTTKQMLGET